MQKGASESSRPAGKYKGIQALKSMEESCSHKKAFKTLQNGLRNGSRGRIPAVSTPEKKNLKNRKERKPMRQE
jgi:hypothetical protein